MIPMNIVTTTFHGAELYGFEKPDGVYVALKPIVTAIGLDWSSQLQRAKRDVILSEGMVIMTIPLGLGGEQEAVCLRLDLLNGWLFGISAGSIKDADKRERILTYQRECYRVLAAHFAGGAPAAIDGAAEPLHIRRSLVTEARQSFGTKSAQELWVSLGLPMLPSMSPAPGQGDLFRGGANG
jgi:hypothetical protein